MQDLTKVLLILLLVAAAMLSFIFLAEVLGVWGIALLEIIITVAIIWLAIKFINPHQGQ